MVVPFATGFVLGTVHARAATWRSRISRILFALFLATAMSISAMPVIAKILMDLDLTRRNIGLVILSAGVVDDTAGWLILSLIAGAASHGGVHVARSARCHARAHRGFIAAMAVVVLYPALRWLVRWSASGFRRRTPIWSS